MTFHRDHSTSAGWSFNRNPNQERRRNSEINPGTLNRIRIEENSINRSQLTGRAGEETRNFSKNRIQISNFSWKMMNLNEFVQSN